MKDTQGKKVLESLSWFLKIIGATILGLCLEVLICYAIGYWFDIVWINIVLLVINAPMILGLLGTLIAWICCGNIWRAYFLDIINLGPKTLVDSYYDKKNKQEEEVVKQINKTFE